MTLSIITYSNEILIQNIVKHSQYMYNTYHIHFVLRNVDIMALGTHIMN